MQKTSLVPNPSSTKTIHPPATLSASGIRTAKNAGVIETLAKDGMLTENVSLSINNLYATQIEKKRDQITDCLTLFEILLKTMRARPIEQNLDEFACLFDHSDAVRGLMYAATMVAYESIYPAGYLLRIRFPPH